MRKRTVTRGEGIKDVKGSGQTSAETNLKAKISKLHIKITCSKRQPTKVNSFQAIHIR